MSAEVDTNIPKENVPEEVVEAKTTTTTTTMEPEPLIVEDLKSTTIESTPVKIGDPTSNEQIAREEPKPTITEPSTTKSVAAEPTTEQHQETAVKLESVKEADAEAAARVESTEDADGEKALSTSQPSVSFDKTTKTHDGSPLSKFFSELPEILKVAGHNEMWGIILDPSEDHVQTSIVLEKFLRANTKDVTKAKAQLTEALKWRKAMQPQKLLVDTEFDKVKFGKLGYVTSYPTSEGGKEVITWNIYGAVKDTKKTFSDVPEFLRWRAALMELSIRELDLASATEKIPENGPDPYRMIQVHDYLNVSFLRMDPGIRAASKETIQTFSMAYPELLKEKFFVNVPMVMGWVFTAMKIFLSADTIKKFHPLSYGSDLGAEIPGIAEKLPKEYGGKGEELESGFTVKYSGDDVPKSD
ncbi:hypothetical protein SS1G_10044 [Sclerotinia sclerotiorum 1980 UF-70]|uniref:Phosphatidylinositol transfer protein sfh5 n=2 Tax=Sclerotinia sclerotiorum (strain ATCC 18683 / 1980 / Ss-1) TaxID=665079 RepID=SFH5_SCLS1|nr:hypothetical protein SS1G_10044 [Sclerotinia sclerotiorum 1980 UF-70]A7EXH9.1 RecName: Full=Phosphatidylinositol transfer protein sfh5; Short=PITP sfh5 [Sclerotinia sclerotiorum 1980 UF-70]APA05568.1 hypothetical protein sscle_01g003380 [Sclerotinia sclerotiorum 1980 UF-70]EDN94171.1 hypothetical protein SS1G_10044 [Sclerotinia sclerotiorum 1980 UF-70]